MSKPSEAMKQRLQSGQIIRRIDVRELISDIEKLELERNKLRIEKSPTVDAVSVDELQAAIDEAESTKDSIVGGSQFAPYMYAYISLRGSIEEMLESARKSGAKMEREEK